MKIGGVCVLIDGLKVCRARTEYYDDVRVTCEEDGCVRYLIKNGVVKVESLARITGVTCRDVIRSLYVNSGATYSLTAVGNCVRVTFYRDIPNDTVSDTIIRIFKSLVNGGR